MTPTISSSEDVASLGANIASVIQRGSVHHALAVRHALPDACCNVLTVLHGVFLHLFDVAFFCGAVSCSNALIVAHVQRITLLEWSKERLLFLFLLFLWERDVRTVCREAWVEAATLTHSVRPWLLTMKDFTVLLGVLVTTHVLFTFIGVLRVSHLVQVRERLCLDARCKSWCTLGDRALGRSQRDVLKLRFSYFPVRLSKEGLCLRVGAHATKALIVFAWVDERITECIALECSECFFCIFATVDCHCTIQTNFVALLSEGLVAGAIVAHSK